MKTIAEMTHYCNNCANSNCRAHAATDRKTGKITLRKGPGSYENETPCIGFMPTRAFSSPINNGYAYV